MLALLAKKKRRKTMTLTILFSEMLVTVLQLTSLLLHRKELNKGKCISRTSTWSAICNLEAAT
jgi:hypothetical protein